MAPVDFSGKWKTTKVENLDDFLKEMGVGFMMRKAAGVASGMVKQKVEQDGDKFVITVTTPKGENVETFTVGEEFEHENKQSGDKGKCVPKWEGNTLVLEFTPADPKKKKQLIVRQLLSETEMLITVQVEGIEDFKRYFQKE